MLPDEVVELIQYVDNNVWAFLFDVIRLILYGIFKGLHWIYTSINSSYEYILKLNPINLLMESDVFDIYGLFGILLLIVFSTALIYGMVVSKKDELKEVMKNAVIAILLLFIIPSFIFNVNKTAISFYKEMSKQTVTSVDDIFKNQFFDTKKSIDEKKPIPLGKEELVMWLDINKKANGIKEYYPSKKLENGKEVWQKEEIKGGWNILGNGQIYAISAKLVQIDLQLFFMVFISAVLVIQFILGLYDLSFSSVGVGAVIAYDTKGQRTKDVLNKFFGALVLLGLVLTMFSFTNLFSFNIISSDFPFIPKLLMMIALALFVIQGSNIIGSALGSSTGAGRSFSAVAGSAFLGGKIASKGLKAGSSLLSGGAKVAKSGYSKGQQAYKQAQKAYTGYQARQQYNGSIRDRNSKLASMAHQGNNKSFAQAMGESMVNSSAGKRNTAFDNNLSNQQYDGRIRDMNNNVISRPQANNLDNKETNKIPEYTPPPVPINVRSNETRNNIANNVVNEYNKKNNFKK